MPSFVSLSSSVFLLILVIFTGSCSETKVERFISDQDTNYSIDIRNISKQINQSPNNPELYYKRSKTFFFEDKYNQAIYDINFALKLDSVNPVYYYFKGNYIMAKDTVDANDAEDCYKMALKLKPDYTDAMTELALIYLAKQNYEEAGDLYTNINRKDPSNPNPYFYLGIIAKEMGDTFKAVSLFEKVLTYDDKYYNAIMQLGDLYAIKRDPKALLFFDRAIKLNEFSSEAYYAKGLYLQNNGLYKDASAMYETVARMNPAHILCRYNLAYINALFENYDIAMKHLNEVLDLAPDYADAYALRGKVNENLKRNQQAIEDYKKAIQLDENQTIAKERLKILSA
jgi:tetratricopeptide (TPR) repeat protein